jgi:hypothetical protein
MREITKINLMIAVGSLVFLPAVYQTARMVLVGGTKTVFLGRTGESIIGDNDSVDEVYAVLSQDSAPLLYVKDSLTGEIKYPVLKPPIEGLERNTRVRHEPSHYNPGALYFIIDGNEAHYKSSVMTGFYGSEALAREDTESRIKKMRQNESDVKRKEIKSKLESLWD